VLDPTPARVPNLDRKLVEDFAQRIGLQYAAEKTYEVSETSQVAVLTPEDLLHYIYAVLHHPGYRERYKEFLKIDFPRIPYPADADQFWALAAIGKELVSLHLLEHPALADTRHRYLGTGDNEVAKGYPQYAEGKVYINATQYFDAVPEVAWQFYIGGYQPAQKWLKDRRGRRLTYEDIRHYLKILIALTETEKWMRELTGIG
jgi:predicted helicase